MRSSEQEIEIHKLIIQKNELALLKLYDTYGETIIDKLKKLYSNTSNTDHSIIIEAVNEALWGYYNNPNTFNPELNTLHRFLEIAAERDLINLLTKEKRYHSQKINISKNVEFDNKTGNSSLAGNYNPENQLIQNELSERINLLLQQHLSNETDIEIAKLILQKERSNTLFAEILNLTHLPLENQTKIVKKNKDRIKKIIERKGLSNKLKQLLT